MSNVSRNAKKSPFVNEFHCKWNKMTCVSTVSFGESNKILITAVLPYQCQCVDYPVHGTDCLSETHNNLIRWDVLVLNLRAHSSQCYKEDGTSKNPDCPVCSKSLNKLAQPLPMAHCANSRLVCKISGEVMNENNPPMMLPNGYVYGYNVSTQH